MRKAFILKVSSLGCFLLSTTALVTAIASDQWIVNRPTAYGPTTDSLWTSCDPSGCTAIQWNTKYMYTNNVALIMAALAGALCTADFLSITFCRKTLGVKLSRAVVLPVILIGICMSVYTWVLTRHIEQKYRGWSFYLGWVSLPLFLIAAVLTILFQIYWQIESEVTTSSMELHARAINT